MYAKLISLIIIFSINVNLFAQDEVPVNEWLKKHYRSVRITGDGSCWLRSIIVTLLNQSKNDDRIRLSLLNIGEKVIMSDNFINDLAINNDLFSQNKLDDLHFYQKTINELINSTSMTKITKFINKRQGVNLDSDRFRLIFRKFVAYKIIQNSLLNIQSINNEKIRQEEIENYKKFTIKHVTNEIVLNACSWGTIGEHITPLIDLFQLEEVPFYDSEYMNLQVLTYTHNHLRHLQQLPPTLIHKQLIINSSPGHYDLLLQKEVQ